jgi:chitin disaccharide deacetylase
MNGTLAQRLGYRVEERLLIINCDDLGSSHSANVATYQAMTRGIATSATLMVPCPWAREAAEMLAGMPVGVHLTVTAEYRGYRWRGLTHGASLHDPDGFLWATRQEAVDCLTMADARAECRAQIETAMRWGVDVTHLDTHMDVLPSRADLFDVYLDLATEFRLPVRALAPEETDRAAARGLLANERILYAWPQGTRATLLTEVSRLSPGVTEIFAHPALDGDELRGYNPSGIRPTDAACLVDPTVAALLDQHRIKRISYRELRALQRAGGE